MCGINSRPGGNLLGPTKTWSEQVFKSTINDFSVSCALFDIKMSPQYNSVTARIAIGQLRDSQLQQLQNNIA